MSHGGSQGSDSTPRLARPEHRLPRSTRVWAPAHLVKRRGLRRARSDRIALGLGGRRRSRPGRLPSVWPSPRSDGGLGRAHFYTCTPRPAPVRLPRAAHAPPKDVKVASGYPAPYPLTVARAPRHEGRWTEKMRRPDVCNRSPTRAPCVLLDSLSLHVIRTACAAFIRAACAADVKDRAERRLTATLRLRADGVRPPPRPPGGEAMVMIGRCSVLAGAAIDSPSGSAPRRRLDSATRRGCDPSSDALCRDRDPRPALARRPSTPAKAETPANATHGPQPDGVGHDRQIRFHRPRVNEGDLHESGRLPSTSAPRCPQFTLLTQGAGREPATVSAASPPRTGFRRSFTPPHEEARPARVHLPPREEEDGPGQRRSPTSAISSTREHNRSIA